jgi:hypothetical protein
MDTNDGTTRGQADMNWVAAAIAITCLTLFIWAVLHVNHKWETDINPPITDNDNHEPITDIDHEK